MRLLATLAISMTLLAAVGCAGQKPATDPAMTAAPVTDVTPMTATAYKPEPMPTVTPMTPVTEVAYTSTPTGPAGNTHVVKKGETFYSVAKQHYGSGKEWKKIASANPGVTPSSLKVGQTLIIP